MRFNPNDGDYLYSAGQMVKSAIGGLLVMSICAVLCVMAGGISVFAIDETKDIVAFGSSDGVMSVERLSDQTTLMRVGDERVPVLSIYYNDDAGVLGFGNAKGGFYLLIRQTGLLYVIFMQQMAQFEYAAYA